MSRGGSQAQIAVILLKKTAMAVRLSTANPDFEVAFQSRILSKRGDEVDLRQQVADILRNVRADQAGCLAQMTNAHDRWPATTERLRVWPDERDAIAAQADRADVAALGFAADRIRAHHQRMMPSDFAYHDGFGTELGWRWTALDSVGLYVPGGRAAYPSSLLMNAIPAQVAGVERLALVTPTMDGVMNPLVFAAAKMLGIAEIYRVGGAQAIGALAYGGEVIAAVDKIVGPGNAYVAEAKRQVFGDVGIDAIAGPSEILVIADASNDPRWIAADLLSQTEHGPDSQAVLISDDAAFIAAVGAAIEAILDGLATGKTARAAWEQHGAMILVADLAGEGARLANRIAAEHVEIAAADAEAIARNIRHAGALFIGPFAPEALGDYVTGSNHVLPTGRAARFSSGLGAVDFLKRMSVQKISAQGFAHLRDAAARLAHAEGLPAHALSVEIRDDRSRR